jgi:hypothetical protein
VILVSGVPDVFFLEFDGATRNAHLMHPESTGVHLCSHFHLHRHHRLLRLLLPLTGVVSSDFLMNTRSVSMVSIPLRQALQQALRLDGHPGLGLGEVEDISADYKLYFSEPMGYIHLALVVLCAYVIVWHGSTWTKIYGIPSSKLR